ncbi:MAG: CHAT domain-containing protein [Cyanobacteria bacterium P01_A01_bin.15]
MTNTTEAKCHYTYRIQITNIQQVQVRKLDPAQNSQGEPSGNFQRNQLEEINSLLATIDEGTFTSAKQSRQLGECLFNVLFDSTLRQDFFNTYQKVTRQDKQLLRVELDINESLLPELAALPWEFMTLPDSANLGTIWLGTDPNIAFSRRRAQWHSAPPIQLLPGEKLRIALAIAAPDDLGPVAYAKVTELLEKLAQKESERIELLPIVNNATSEAIDQLMEKQPHIFHFIGHGRLQDDGDNKVGQIALMDDVFDEASWVDAGFFSEQFSRWQPGVVLLQACEGGKLTASKAFVGAASKIVQQNIPVVVAMQYEVSNITASRFAYRFYERLAQGNPVDKAAQEGRYAIARSTQYRKQDFSTPVIFMRVQNGTLFSEAVWEPLDFDEKSMQRAIKRINTCISELSSANSTDYMTQLTSDEYQDLVLLNSEVQKLKDLDQELKNLEKTSNKILDKAIEKLKQKIDSFDSFQQEELESASSQVCTKEQLAILSQFKASIEDAKKVAAWIDADLAAIARAIGRSAINGHLGKEKALSDLENEAFSISIEKILERVSHCLKWGKCEILDAPGITLIVSKDIYKAALEYLREILPKDKDRITQRGAEQFNFYIDYSIERLSYYENL